MDKKNITVTSPLLPDLEEFTKSLQEIWQRKWITNNGVLHAQLELALAEYLKVPYVSLFTNGTLPLLTALQALRITGEVIVLWQRHMLYGGMVLSQCLWMWICLREILILRK